MHPFSMSCPASFETFRAMPYEEREDYLKAQEFYDNLVKEGKTPYFMCDDVIFEKLSGNCLPLGKTGKEIASNLYYRLLEGEKIADYIIAISVDSGSDIDNGIMNRMSKACKKA